MNKIIDIATRTLLVAAIIISLVIFISRYNSDTSEDVIATYEERYLEYQKLIVLLQDSLQKQTHTIDSLYSVKSKIHTKYETIYNYISIAEADSITRYISNKIYNR